MKFPDISRVFSFYRQVVTVILTKEKITQTSGANSKHKQIERFSALNEQIITFVLGYHTIVKTRKTPSLTVSSVTCTNQSL